MFFSLHSQVHFPFFIRMSRTHKTYKNFTFNSKKTWQQTSLNYCTQCGTRCCGDPSTIDGTKASNKCKGTHKDKRYMKEIIDDS
jgi:hypothetical protein